jgi:hypothetical protein
MVVPFARLLFRELERAWRSDLRQAAEDRLDGAQLFELALAGFACRGVALDHFAFLLGRDVVDYCVENIVPKMGNCIHSFRSLTTDVCMTVNLP